LHAADLPKVKIVGAFLETGERRWEFFLPIDEFCMIWAKARTDAG